MTNDESAGLARMRAHLGRLFRAAKNPCTAEGEERTGGGRERTYAGPTVEPTTWAVITASAVGRTVTHVNARERRSEAAILVAAEKLLFRLPRQRRRRGGGENSRGLSWRLAPRRARRFDARARARERNFSAPKRWEPSENRAAYVGESCSHADWRSKV